jgi:general secretion pathway protein I
MARRIAPPKRRWRQGGFTLLEVMVALAILGLSLTAILSAQAGLYDANVRARNVSLATSAARCKMNEVEVTLLRDGYPEADETHDGPCCDGESPQRMSCRWQIERVLLPDPPATDSSADGGIGGGSSGAGGGGLGAFGALAGMAGSAGGLGDGGIAGVSEMLAAGTGPNGQGGAMGIAGMALTMVYPTLRPLLEASIRRVTVDVVWNEGPNERTMKIVQFVTSAQRGLPPIGLGTGDAGVPPNLLRTQ